MALADKTITVGATATGLGNVTEFEPYMRRIMTATISVLSGTLRIRMTGQDPTTTADSHPIPAGTMFDVIGTNDLKNLRMIRDGSVNAVLFVTIG